MWRQHSATVLRVELAANEPLKGRNLHNFNKTRIWVCTRSHHTCSLKIREELRVKLIPVAMTLSDESLAINLKGLAALLELAVVSSESHCATKVADALLILHNVDYWIWSRVVHFRAVGALPMEYVAGELNDSHLHAKTNPEEWDVVLASIPGSDNLAIDAAAAEARRHDYALKTGELGCDVRIGDAFRVNEFKLCLTVVVCGRMVDGFDD